MLSMIQQSVTWNSPKSANADLVEINSPSSSSFGQTEAGARAERQRQFADRRRCRNYRRGSKQNFDIVDHMKIDERVEYHDETVRYSATSRYKDPAANSRQSAKNFSKGSVCSAREREAQILQEHANTLKRIENMKQLRENPDSEIVQKSKVIKPPLSKYPR